MCIHTVWHAEIASVTLETSVLCNRDVIGRIPMVCSQERTPRAVSSHTLVVENAESTLTGVHIITSEHASTTEAKPWTHKHASKRHRLPHGPARQHVHHVVNLLIGALLDLTGQEERGVHGPLSVHPPANHVVLELQRHCGQRRVEGEENESTRAHGVCFSRMARHAMSALARGLLKLPSTHRSRPGT